MWRRILLSIICWLLFKPIPLGISLKTIISLLDCSYINIQRIEQRGQGFFIQVMGSGLEQCLQKKRAYCQPEKHYYNCYVMGEYLDTVRGVPYRGEAV